MYNVERYVGQCLESLLNQTFQDFEVIIVDDCSTDSSFSIAESFIPRFNNHLKLIKHKMNSGNCAVPRNTAMKFAKGKYICFLDSDDLLINNALEVFYGRAEQTQADVVYSEKYFLMESEQLIETENITKKINYQISPTSYQRGSFVENVIIETDDLAKRLIDFYNVRYTWNVWTKFYRHDFLSENNIEFTDMLCEDVIFTFSCLFCAKTYVRIPDIVYVYRQRENSITTKNQNLYEQVRKFSNIIVIGIKSLNEFMKDRVFFVENPSFRYLIFDTFMREFTNYFIPIYKNVPSHVIEPILKDVFSNNSSENLTFMAYLFSCYNVHNLQLIQAQQEINQLRQQINDLKEV